MLSKFEVVYGHISVFCLNLTLEQGPLVVLARVPVDRPLARVPVCPEGGRLPVCPCARVAVCP